MTGGWRGVLFGVEALAAAGAAGAAMAHGTARNNATAKATVSVSVVFMCGSGGWCVIG